MGSAGSGTIANAFEVIRTVNGPVDAGHPFRPDDRDYRIQSEDSLLFLSPDQRSLEAVFGIAAAWRRALLFD